jgi:hypothetical protein
VLVGFSSHFVARNTKPILGRLHKNVAYKLLNNVFKNVFVVRRAARQGLYSATEHGITIIITGIPVRARCNQSVMLISRYSVKIKTAHD